MTEAYRQHHGRILCDAHWLDGTLTVAPDGRIAAIEERAGAPGPGPAATLLPGFIDLHVHGGGGADIMQGGDAAARIAAAHVRHGTTSLLATTMTAPMAELEAVLGGLGQACGARRPGAARVLGVHLEGPFINQEKLGAQPDHACVAVIDSLRRLRSLAPIRVITIAPEIAGHLAIIRELSADGVRMQIGHTSGSYDDGVAGLRHGATSFAHLFNAMTGLHHRQPGIVGAALAHARYAEIIPDLLHVHPGALLAALRAIPHLYCVTDSTSATGMADGDYRLGSHTVHKCQGGVRLADGTLAGSCLTMDQALRNLVSVGLELADASRRLSAYPADYLGVTDRGRLRVGAWADIAIFDEQLALRGVVAEGERIALAHA